MIQRFKKLLVARQATGVVHDHGLPHGKGQKQHGRDGGDDAGPAQTHVIGVGLVAGGEAAACVRTGPRRRKKRQRRVSWGLWCWFS